MNIEITEIRNNPESIYLHGEAEAFPELLEVGCRDSISAIFRSTPVNQGFWLKGRVEGGFAFECRNCGSPLSGKFQIPLKLHIKLKTKGTFTWLEDQVEQFDEYVVEIGSGVQKIPIISIIREQIILKYNSAVPGESDRVDKCKNCYSSSYDETSSAALQDKSEPDPRWDKLKKLLKKN